MLRIISSVPSCATGTCSTPTGPPPSPMRRRDGDSSTRALGSQPTIFGAISRCSLREQVKTRFLVKALACNLPISFVNHPEAPHAFDLFHDSETSRGIISRILPFLQSHLLA